MSHDSPHVLGLAEYNLLEYGQDRCVFCTDWLTPST